jgi:CheY-like chemotaxis protein
LFAVDSPKSLRVFLVENDEDTLKYFRMFLEDVGHKVQEARTVADALAAIPAAGCDVLICDVGLADGTAWELLQKLRERGLAYPAYTIAMSGYATAGFRHHLLKPIDVEDVEKLLEEAAHEQAA